MVCFYVVEITGFLTILFKKSHKQKISLKTILKTKISTTHKAKLDVKKSKICLNRPLRPGFWRRSKDEGNPGGEWEIGIMVNGL